MIKSSRNQALQHLRKIYLTSVKKKENERRTSPRKTPSKTPSKTPTDISTDSILNASDSDSTVKDKIDFVSFKKRAVLESDSEVIFSDENPFQSVNKPKQKIKFKKATDMHAIKVNFTEQDEFNILKDKTQLDDANDTICGDHAAASTTGKQNATPDQKEKITQKSGSAQKVTFKATTSVKKLLSSKKAATTKSESNKSDSPDSNNSSVTKPTIEILSENTDDQIFVEYTPEKLGTPAKKSLKDRLLARKRAKQRSQMPMKICTGFMSVFVLLLAFWLQFDQPKLHYCSDANEYDQLRQSNNTNDLYLSFLPSCVDCPKNSICNDRQVVSCVSNDYRLKNSTFEKFLPAVLMSFPFGQPTCVLDSFRILNESKKSKQTQHLIKVIDEIVREFVGNLECSRNTLGKDLEWVFSTKPPHLPLGIPVTNFFSTFPKVLKLLLLFNGVVA
jgi:hypothetical protein